jgi:endonuclease III
VIGVPAWSAIRSLIDALARDAGEPAREPVDPYAAVLHENAGYLVDDARRDALYARIVALAPNPRALLAADREQLLAIARDGGMRPEERVERWRAIAEITLGEADGDLLGALRALPPARAKRLLRRYPAIGEPGAERILLFANVAPVASVESNGLRVLERYGVVVAGQPYARAYRDACTVLRDAFGDDGDALRRAFLALRRHGKTLCRRTVPDCPRCPVRTACPSSLAR